MATGLNDYVQERLVAALFGCRPGRMRPVILVLPTCERSCLGARSRADCVPILDYRAAVGHAMRVLTSGSVEVAIAPAEQADLVRGYEQVKLDNVERFNQGSAAVGAALEHGVVIAE